MEEGPVWKIATESPRELSQFASTIPVLHLNFDGGLGLNPAEA